MQQRLSPGWRRVVIAIAGGSVTVAGLIMVPYPGPGWLVVFAGLAILAQEFAWARHLLKWARRKYDGFYAWVGRQDWPIRFAMLVFTVTVVVVTLWLLNAYGIMAGWFGIDLPWLRSPFLQ